MLLNYSENQSNDQAWGMRYLRGILQPWITISTNSWPRSHSDFIDRTKILIFDFIIAFRGSNLSFLHETFQTTWVLNSPCRVSRLHLVLLMSWLAQYQLHYWLRKSLNLNSYLFTTKLRYEVNVQATDNQDIGCQLRHHVTWHQDQIRAGCHGRPLDLSMLPPVFWRDYCSMNRNLLDGHPWGPRRSDMTGGTYSSKPQGLYRKINVSACKP